MDSEETKVCVKCGEGPKDDHILHQVGRNWSIEKGTANPLNTLIDLAVKNGLTSLESTLRHHKQEKISTFIHLSFRTKLRNQTRLTKRTSSSTVESTSKRLYEGSFNFKNQCFYCGTECIFDIKHPGRNNFIEVRTISTNIHKQTLAICEARDDITSKTVETRLLSLNDLVAAEARYHISCQTKFENPLPEHPAPGRPISLSKTAVFEKACELMENDMNLYTVSEFHALISKSGGDVHTPRTVKTKLKQKYKEFVKFATRDGKSDIILLDRTTKILSEDWYNTRKANLDDESVRIVQTAATLIKDAIRNHELESNVYPSMDDIAKGINLIPDLLKTFVNELIKSPVKQMSISQAIVAAARPRTIMPLLFGLAISTDNLIGSKWLNNILSKMGFAVSYDEVNQLYYQLFKNMSFSEIKFHLIISAISTFESASHSFNA